MTYTVRFAHLAEKPTLEPGRIIRKGDRIGMMGSTGQSSAAHVHMDIVNSCASHRYSLADIANGKPRPEPVELLRFLNDGLFGIAPVVTTGYDDPSYALVYNKRHLGVDIVPDNRKASKNNWTLKWPLNVPGRVMAIYDNDPGYGYAVLIAYEV